MSSIDKAVRLEAQKCDSRVNVSNKNGRIIGRIGNTVIFNLNDRYGYLSQNEKEEIHTQIKKFRLEEQRRHEEEQRRLEEEKKRREAYRHLQNQINYKLSIIQSNKVNLTKIYDIKKLELSNFDKEFDNIINMLPSACLDKLNNEKKSLIKKLEDNYKLSMDKINELETRFELFNFNENSSIDVLQNLSLSIENINEHTVGFDLSTDIEQFKKILSVAKKNAIKLSEIINQANMIDDSFILDQIKAEVNNIDLLNTNAIKNIYNSIANRITTYKSRLEQKKVRKQIDNLNKIEALIKSNQELVEYGVDDPYNEKNWIEDNLRLVNEAIEKINNLQQIEYKVCDLDFSEYSKKLYEQTINPQNSEQTNDWLEKLVGELNGYLDTAQRCEQAYNIFKSFVNELQEYGATYDEEFDCDNYSTQLHFLEIKIIEAMENKEQGNLYEAYFNIIDAMEKCEYELFSQKNDQYSCEVYFINKKYPSVLTRFIIDNKGNYRRSLVGIKIDEYVTTNEELLRVSKEIENDVALFMEEMEQLSKGEVQIVDSVLYDSENAVERLSEIGSFELDEEGKSIYNEFMGISNDASSVLNEQQKFGIWNQNINKVIDSREERNRIQANTPSYQRKHRHN